MDHPTIWGHNCRMHHKIFNLFSLNSLSIGARCILWILGWQVHFEKQCFSKYKNVIRPCYDIENVRNLICVAPHTSVWDGIITILIAFRYKIPLVSAAKYELFWGPFRYILLYLGMIPIYWDRKSNTTEQIVSYFKDYNLRNPDENLCLGIFPEGNRWKDRWRSGYWFIAKQLDRNILTIGLDYEKQSVVLASIVVPTDCFENDNDVIKEQLYPYIPMYPEHTDLITRFDEIDSKKKTCPINGKNMISLMLYIIVIWITYQLV